MTKKNKTDKPNLTAEITKVLAKTGMANFRPYVDITDLFRPTYEECLATLEECAAAATELAKPTDDITDPAEKYLSLNNTKMLAQLLVIEAEYATKSFSSLSDAFRKALHVIHNAPYQIEEQKIELLKRGPEAFKASPAYDKMLGSPQVRKAFGINTA